MGYDVAILETSNGGDFTMKGKSDLQLYYNDENDIYLRLFGGNIEQDTKGVRQPGEEDLSWWGNKLLFGTDKNIQFNSTTERTLKATALSSTGRQAIENAVKKDLSGLDVTVTVIITAIDRADVIIKQVLPKETKTLAKFSFVKNSNAGDFDLSDFAAIDFY